MKTRDEEQERDLALSRMAVPTLDIFLELYSEMDRTAASDNGKERTVGKNGDDCEEAAEDCC